MLTYQIRPRIYRYGEGETEQEFPAECTVRFYFLPEQPFGERADGGRTAVQAVAARALFNANTGVHTIESHDPLCPLDVKIEEPSREFELSGRILSVTQRFDSLNELDQLVASIYFVLPPLLATEFADPPYIERVDGVINGAEFRWELSEWRMSFETTTQERQEGRVVRAWERMAALSADHRRRLIAGLHYFHVGCRLSRAGHIAGEFVAEVILNFAKCLEVLFPPAGDGRTRDAVRNALRELGCGENEIERDFLPAMALRNEIDVAHVELGLFTMDQLKVIHGYTERAESAFRVLFERLFEAIVAGTWDVPDYELGSPSREAIRLVERLREHAEE